MYNSIFIPILLSNHAHLVHKIVKSRHHFFGFHLFQEGFGALALIRFVLCAN